MAIRIYGTSFDTADAAVAAAFWADVLGRSVNPGATKESASLVALEGSGDTPIMFHAVPEAKVVKNRLHLDLIADDFDAELTRLRSLGANELAEFPNWTTLTDPEGNEFDLIRG
jgi:predicted enzyme related to lactoylglutathione lyase